MSERASEWFFALSAYKPKALFRTKSYNHSYVFSPLMMKKKNPDPHPGFHTAGGGGGGDLSPS